MVDADVARVSSQAHPCRLHIGLFCGPQPKESQAPRHPWLDPLEPRHFRSRQAALRQRRRHVATRLNINANAAGLADSDSDPAAAVGQADVNRRVGARPPVSPPTNGDAALSGELVQQLPANRRILAVFPTVQLLNSTPLGQRQP